MRYFFILIFCFFINAQALQAKEIAKKEAKPMKIDAKPIKINGTVLNARGVIKNALAFVYLEDSLIGYSYSDKKGNFDLHLQRESVYTITISKPGHLTSSINFDTHNMREDIVKKVDLPIKLYSIRQRNVKKDLVSFSIKWNYILEGFESFNYNMGWKMELREKQGGAAIRKISD